MVEEEELPTFAAAVNGGEELLPAYDDGIDTGIATPGPSRPGTSAETPRYPTEHVYALGAEKKQPWAHLKVKSRTRRAKKLPVYMQGDKIKGTVELDLEKSDSIRAVTLQVRGETWSGETWAPELEGTVPLEFWSHTTTLWSAEPCSRNDPSGSARPQGKYVWPFSIALPNGVVHSRVLEGPDFMLPPNFGEKGSPIYVDYKIVVTFSRGRLRVDNILSTSFIYLALSRPTAPSRLRQLAYREERPPPGPQRDPKGWKVLGPTSIVGMLFDTREVEAICMFALAKPLCYARGTFIPFALTITCSDSLALDLFAARGSLAVHLMRTLDVNADATSLRPKRVESDIFTCVGTGIYWPSEEDNVLTETRKIEGEIPIKANLKPSFDFPLLSLKYHVSLILKAPGFNALRTGGNVRGLVFSQAVTIASSPAPGPPPMSRAPSGGRLRHHRRVS